MNHDLPLTKMRWAPLAEHPPGSLVILTYYRKEPAPPCLGVRIDKIPVGGGEFVAGVLVLSGAPYEGGKMGPGTLIADFDRQTGLFEDGLLGGQFPSEIEIAIEQPLDQSQGIWRPGAIGWGEFGLAVSGVGGSAHNRWGATTLVQSWTVNTTGSMRPVATAARWDWVLDLGGGRAFRVAVESALAD